MSSESEEAPLLIQYVKVGQKQVVEELLSGENKPDVNEQDGYGSTAALIAAERDDLEMLKLLVKNGANLNLKDCRGRTVIGWAKYNKDNNMIEFIENELSKPSAQNGALSSSISKQHNNALVNTSPIRVGGK